MSLYKDLAKRVAYQKDLTNLSKEIEVLALNFLDKYDGQVLLKDVINSIAQGKSNFVETVAKSTLETLKQGA